MLASGSLALKLGQCARQTRCQVIALKTLTWEVWYRYASWMLRLEVDVLAQAHEFESLNVKLDAQPCRTVLPEAETAARTPPSSHSKIGVASCFDQVLVIFWTYRVIHFP